jgi:hypothetical protein
MARIILLLGVLLIGGAWLPAAGLDTTWRTPGQRTLKFTEDVARGQLVDDSGPRTTEQLFGAGVALGVNSAALGLGVSGWFDVYFTPWISAGLHSGVAYGILGRRYKDGGTALAWHLCLGAKFTFDMEDWDWSRWVRPWVALYPVGFQLLSATEDFNPAGPDRLDTITYTDVFFYISGAIGVDFYLTSLIGIGAAIYPYGTFGGRRHDDNGTTVRTRGYAGVYFEYVRLSLRF